ncbi:uncharacterized protein LOC130649321 [Hydractinia symbiolongicarpus]|uniref:uncharacterized protein LOC130649124 n=1 Tax=Hydractinia symbiolongicarpus TaxID=13093 RepID=UPI00255056A0|nr:uncharacterized protein LOC130649124 [Hydractinia symbiolongicarpus]XP_057311561.1 uncharacterized protein LOC130649321 [Hydractinia symbiolongicarpus]
MRKKGSHRENIKAVAASTQRKLNKSKRRTKVLQAMDLPEEKKAKILKVLGVQYMSSEEEIDDNNGRYFTVHPLPWKCKKLNSTFKKLDARHQENQNKRSKNQTVRREEGRPSERNQPPDAPSFAIAPFDESQ